LVAGQLTEQSVKRENDNPKGPLATTGSQQTHLKDEFEELAAYLVDEKAPKKVHSAF
jgi:hypothetical protein